MRGAVGFSDAVVSCFGGDEGCAPPHIQAILRPRNLLDHLTNEVPPTADVPKK